MAVVKKGAGRASHSAKTNKAAQRTPLPPKNTPVPRTAVAAIKDEVAKGKAPKEAPPQYAKAGAFAAEAEKLGWKLTKKAEGTRAEVLGTRGAESFHIAWDNNVYERWAGYTATTGGVEKKIPNAKSMLVQLALSPEQAAAQPQAKAAKTRRVSGGVASPVSRDPGAMGSPEDGWHLPTPEENARMAELHMPVNLPWDPATATDDDVREAVKGKKLRWRNTLIISLAGDAALGAIQEATVPRDQTVEEEIKDDNGKSFTPAKFRKVKQAPRHLTVSRDEKSGNRIINFASMEGAFRAVAEHALISVR